MSQNIFEAQLKYYSSEIKRITSEIKRINNTLNLLKSTINDLKPVKTLTYKEIYNLYSEIPYPEDK